MKELKPGLSGIVRAKNEASFIEACIDSCIDALDELVIVYNDCTDDTPAIVKRKAKQYPDKIKIYAYEHHVLSYNLTKEEFEYALSLPDDSPLLFCNQCNFALSKVSYKYAMIIDPDQFYFADELEKWRDVCRGKTRVKWQICFVFGWLFVMWFSAYRRLSNLCGKPCLWMLPDWLIELFYGSYQEYSKWRLQQGDACIALSGVNVFKDDRWYIPFDGVNVHPPYNGASDHLIFPASEQTFFYRRAAEAGKRSFYSILESFHCPYKAMYAGAAWFHLHANREYCRTEIKKMKDLHPDWFVPIEDFPKMSYKEVHAKMDKKAHSLHQRIFFALVHKISKSKIASHFHLLH